MRTATAALNDAITRALGDQLYRAEDAPGPNALGATPVDSLRGKVLTLLSGDVTSRSDYLRNLGDDPAVALNSAGQAVEVHATATGRLHYWSGQYQNNGMVSWQRTGIFPPSGMTPAVALDDSGNVVVVYGTPATFELSYLAGTLDGSTGRSPGRRGHRPASTLAWCRPSSSAAATRSARCTAARTTSRTGYGTPR